tara:strand:- start:4759 stop:6033 length:1275 start_codon:yes stop_codon:yes gene_type:complete
MNYVSYKINVDTNSFDYCIDNNIEVFSLMKNKPQRVETTEEKYFVVIDCSTAAENWTYNSDGNILLFDVLERELKSDSKFGLIYKDLLERKCSIFFYFRERTFINTDNFFSHLDSTLQKLNLDKNQVLFSIIEFYYDGLKNNDYKIIQIPFYAFNTCWWSVKRAKRLKDFYNLYSHYSKTFLRQKNFICTNNRIRHFRTWVTYILFEGGLLDRGYVSYLANNDDPENKYNFDDFTLDVKHSLGKDSEHIFSDENNKNLKKFYNLLPIECDTKKDIRISNHESGMAIQGIMLNSYLNIVTEASANYAKNEVDNVFMTEKTWKPILAQQPFILIGQQKHLHALRKMGFETFQPFIDESYDDTVGIGKYQIIKKEIKRVASMNRNEIDKWYWEMEEILQHNSNNFLNLFRSSVREINNFIEDAWSKI